MALSNQLALLESATDSRCQSLPSDICEVRESLHQVSHKLSPLLRAPASSDPGVVGSSGSQSMPAVIAPSGASQNRDQHTAFSRDRSCNLVVSGVPECPQGTHRTARALQDQDSIVSALSPLCSSFSAHSIRDMFRLGKYNRERSRPILVKLHRPLDVSVILSNKRMLVNSLSISVRPDLSSSDKVAFSLLLKEHWSLITSGVDSCHIKIKQNCPYSQGHLHGKVVDGSFVPEPTPSHSDHASAAVTPSDAPPNLIPPSDSLSNVSPILSPSSAPVSHLPPSPSVSGSFQ